MSWSCTFSLFRAPVLRSLLGCIFSTKWVRRCTPPTMGSISFSTFYLVESFERIWRNCFLSVKRQLVLRHPIHLLGQFRLRWHRYDSFTIVHEKASSWVSSVMDVDIYFENILTFQFYFSSCTGSLNYFWKRDWKPNSVGYRNLLLTHSPGMLLRIA